MVLRRAKNPIVRTELSVKEAQPGGRIEGVIEVIGGDRQTNVGHVTIQLAVNSTLDLASGRITDAFTLDPGETRLFPFIVDVPWDCPLSFDVVDIAVRTELELPFAFDPIDLDPVRIAPLPAQQHILDCLHAMGFQIHGSNLELGCLDGVPIESGFYQEILLGTAGRPRLRGLELTFVATPEHLHVVLEADRRVPLLSDPDVFGRFVMEHDNLGEIDWCALLDSWLSRIAR